MPLAVSIVLRPSNYMRRTCAQRRAGRTCDAVAKINVVVRRRALVGADH